MVEDDTCNIAIYVKYRVFGKNTLYLTLSSPNNEVYYRVMEDNSIYHTVKPDISTLTLYSVSGLFKYKDTTSSLTSLPVFISYLGFEDIDSLLLSIKRGLK